MSEKVARFLQFVYHLNCFMQYESFCGKILEIEMQKRKFLLTIVAGVAGAVSPTVSFAGGGATGGATEMTQLVNKVQLVMSYGKQVQQYVTQLLQYQADITNLIKNPMSLLGPEIGNMINGIGKIMSMGRAIGSNIAQIDKNFGTMFKDTNALSLAKNFTRWHDTSIDTIEGALKAAGLHMETYANESAKIQALYSDSQKTGGNLEALQTLSKINVEQIQQMQRLGNLLSTQNIAMSTYMAEQTSKQNEIITKYGGYKINTDPVPPVGEKPVRTWKEVVVK